MTTGTILIRAINLDEVAEGSRGIGSSFVVRDLKDAVPSVMLENKYAPLSYAFTTAVSRARLYVKVGILERGGEVVGFLPFQFSNLVRRLLRSAERVGGDMSDHCGIIGVADFRLSPEQVLELTNLSAFEFQDLSGLQKRYGLEGERATQGMRLDLGAGGTAYWLNLKQVNRHFTAEVKRGERQLVAKFGPLQFIRDTSESDAEKELSRLIFVKGQQYMTTIRKNLFHESWRRDLLRHILRSGDDQCAGVLSTLYAGETWVASHFGIRSNNVLHYWFPVYNVDFHRYSPGHILTKYLICSAGEWGLAHLDLGGYGDYKRQFRPESYAMSAGMWLSSGTAGLMSHAYQSLAWWITTLHSRLMRKAH